MTACDDTPNIWKANISGFAKAGAHLDGGGLVAIPTETVYGLAADARNGAAVAAIYATKARPHFNPLIVHIANLSQLTDFAVLTDTAHTLSEAFWPGPLTLVLPLKSPLPLSSLVTAGLDTVAVRMPAHPAARAILEALGRPFVAPSANRSGRISPTRPAHVLAEFGDTVPIVDGGPCTEGIESTIIDLTQEQIRLLRPGTVTPDQIEAALGMKVLTSQGDAILAPGMMRSHYAPRGDVRLNAQDAREGEAMLGFGGTLAATLDLSVEGDLLEAAANLFDFLRQLDQTHDAIAVAPIPQRGIGIAINDRLSRAAAPR